jgi:hypothetical protein
MEKYFVLDSHGIDQKYRDTARSVRDETRNDRRNANRNPEWFGDLSQLQNKNHNLNLYWEIQRNSNLIKISI